MPVGFNLPRGWEVCGRGRWGARGLEWCGVCGRGEGGGGVMVGVGGGGVGAGGLCWG